MSTTKAKAARKPSPRSDEDYMREALQLAKQAAGFTSPNPMVGALLVRNRQVLGRGWHARAGGPHAEIVALEQARSKRRRLQGATLYVTLEPCSTTGRTPPCTEAILEAGLSRVVVGAVDPNPAHAGRGLTLLRDAGIEVVDGVLAAEAARLNEPFNHWIVHRTPWVTVKAAMTLDGKIATTQGESKWITGPAARARALEWRQGADAVLVGIGTVLADDPSLTSRSTAQPDAPVVRCPRRIILDSRARTPLTAKIVSDEYAARTTIVVTKDAPRDRVEALGRKVQVWEAPIRKGRVDPFWLVRRLGAEEVTSLLVEGGGEIHASFLLEGLADRVAFFYAPKILGGHRAPKAVGGQGVHVLARAPRLEEVSWELVGPDLLLTARVKRAPRRKRRSRSGIGGP